MFVRQPTDVVDIVLVVCFDRLRVWVPVLIYKAYANSEPLREPFSRTSHFTNIRRRESEEQ